MRRANLTLGGALTRRFNLVRPYLTRRQLKVWAAAEAEAAGRGGRALVASVTGISPTSISLWISKCRATGMAAAGTLVVPKIAPGAGRRRVEEKDKGIEAALERLLTEEIAGDPMTDQRWIRSSLRRLSKGLKERGHQAGHGTVARLLRKMGFSLRVNKKRQSGSQHPDRDKQFHYIKSMKERFELLGQPIISVDTKKKELIGDFKNEGKTWCREPAEVEEHFASYSQYVAVPFGIYDVKKNTGFVVVGISHNTAEFAVNCLTAWWKKAGCRTYLRATELLILADGGGGNGYNLRTWKKDIQEKLCNPAGLAVTVAHYPPGCSKWNPVEYRLFSQISINWAGKPLRTIEMMLGYIRGTTTATGLRVQAQFDARVYQKGRKVTARGMEQLNLRAHKICPTWNYTLRPSH
jgi:hypothetical protein